MCIMTYNRVIKRKIATTMMSATTRTLVVNVELMHTYPMTPYKTHGNPQE